MEVTFLFLPGSWLHASVRSSTENIPHGGEAAKQVAFSGPRKSPTLQLG